MDEETPFKMRWGTLKKIIMACVLGAAGAVGWAVNIKQSITAQAERSERIEVRINSLESNSREQTNAMYDQKTKLLLIDQKLDNIASRQTTTR